MRKLVPALALVTLLASAQAADWNGPYVGLLAGASFGSATTGVALKPQSGANFWLNEADAAQINGLPAGTASAAGALGGIEGGYRWQLSKWVLGMAADFSSMALSQSTHWQGGYDSYPGGYNTYLDEFVRTDWLITLRPQLGYALGPWLLQGSAGLALANRQMGGSWQDENIPYAPQLFVRSGSSELATGFAAGLGVERRLGEHCSVGLDYLYVKFPQGKFTANNGFARTNGGNFDDEFTFTFDLAAQLTRLSVRYLF